MSIREDTEEVAAYAAEYSDADADADDDADADADADANPLLPGAQCSQAQSG